MGRIPAPESVDPHFNGTATALADGRVLITGGLRSDWDLPMVSDKAEIYDPATNSWSLTEPLNRARVGHSAVRLAGGRVLMVGGGRSRGAKTTWAAIYRPGTGTWAGTAPMAVARYDAQIALLGDGRVLVVGGDVVDSSWGGVSAEIYDPSTGSWSPAPQLTGSSPEPTGAVTLPDGRVLVTVRSAADDPARIFDPATDTWEAAGAGSTAG